MPKAQKPQEAMPLEELEIILSRYGRSLVPPSRFNDAYCEICGHLFSSVRALDKHLDTKKHDKELQRFHLALDMAEQSGRLDNYEDACRFRNSLPYRWSNEERDAANEKAWAALQDIVSYWKISNSAAATTKSVPPISL